MARPSASLLAVLVLTCSCGTLSRSGARAPDLDALRTQWSDALERWLALQTCASGVAPAELAVMQRTVASTVAMHVSLSLSSSSAALEVQLEAIPEDAPPPGAREPNPEFVARCQRLRVLLELPVEVADRAEIARRRLALADLVGQIGATPPTVAHSWRPPAPPARFADAQHVSELRQVAVEELEAATAAERAVIESELRPEAVAAAADELVAATLALDEALWLALSCDPPAIEVARAGLEAARAAIDEDAVKRTVAPGSAATNQLALRLCRAGYDRALAILRIERDAAAQALSRMPARFTLRTVALPATALADLQADLGDGMSGAPGMTDAELAERDRRAWAEVAQLWRRKLERCEFAAEPLVVVNDAREVVAGRVASLDEGTASLESARQELVQSLAGGGDAHAVERARRLAERRHHEAVMGLAAAMSASR